MWILIKIKHNQDMLGALPDYLFQLSSFQLWFLRYVGKNGEKNYLNSQLWLFVNDPASATFNFFSAGLELLETQKLV